MQSVDITQTIWWDTPKMVPRHFQIDVLLVQAQGGRYDSHRSFLS